MVWNNMTYNLGKVDFLSSIHDNSACVVRILVDKDNSKRVKKLYHKDLNKVCNVKCEYRDKKILLTDTFIERISTLNRTDNKIKLVIIARKVEVK